MIAIIVNIQAKPESVEALLEALAENAHHSNQEPGCRKWEFSRHLEDETRFAIYEVYDDESAIEAHLASDHFKRWFAVAPSLWESKESARYAIL